MRQEVPYNQWPMSTNRSCQSKVITNDIDDRNKTLTSQNRKTVFPLISARPPISATALGVHVEISHAL